MNRYRIENPNTATVHVPSMQRAGDILFNFKNSPDFSFYRVIDAVDGLRYRAHYDPGLNAVVLEHDGAELTA